jgi:hypothetical protein
LERVQSRRTALATLLVATTMVSAILTDRASVLAYDWAPPPRYHSETYWNWDSVILAKVIEIRPAPINEHRGIADGPTLYANEGYPPTPPAGENPQPPAPEPEDMVVVEPIGTLSGKFDSGANTRVTVIAPHMAQKLRTGSTVLVALCNYPTAYTERRTKTWFHLEEDDRCAYMPAGDGGIKPVEGFSDDDVKRTLEMIQQFRRKPTGTGSRNQ